MKKTGLILLATFFLSISTMGQIVDTSIVILSNKQFKKVISNGILLGQYIQDDKVIINKFPNFSTLVLKPNTREDSLRNVLQEIYAIKIICNEKGNYAITTQCAETIREMKFYSVSNVIIKEADFGCGDMKNGKWKYYYPNGIIKSEGQYHNNKKKGLWRNYDETGNIKGEKTY